MSKHAGLGGPFYVLPNLVFRLCELGIRVLGPKPHQGFYKINNVMLIVEPV